MWLFFLYRILCEKIRLLKECLLPRALHFICNEKITWRLYILVLTLTKPRQTDLKRLKFLKIKLNKQGDSKFSNQQGKLISLALTRLWPQRLNIAGDDSNCGSFRRPLNSKNTSVYFSLYRCSLLHRSKCMWFYYLTRKHLTLHFWCDVATWIFQVTADSHWTGSIMKSTANRINSACTTQEACKVTNDQSTPNVQIEIRITQIRRQTTIKC